MSELAGWAVIVRNDDWDWPDVFGPFDSIGESQAFIDEHIDHDVVEDEDVTTQQLLDPEYYKHYREDDVAR